MRVRYYVQADPGDDNTIDEYVAFEHKGYPRRKAEIWWYHHAPNIPCPRSAQEAVQHGMRGNFRCPRYIHVVEDGPWNRIIHIEFA
jgi:DNA repair protein RadD